MDELSLETPDFTVCLKKGYWVMTLLCGIFLLGSSVLAAVMPFLCQSIGQFAVCIGIFLLLAAGGVWALLSLRIRAEVYADGQIQYHNGLRMRQYHISQIASCETKTESVRVRHSEGLVSDYWDEVTVFKDANGKKLFRFGLAYRNVDSLARRVKSVQKAAARRVEKEKGKHSRKCK